MRLGSRPDGIVGAIAERNIVPILTEGLRRFEYRGYDSASTAIVDESHHLARLRTVGDVKAPHDALNRTTHHGVGPAEVGTLTRRHATGTRFSSVA
jgi:glucosamine 6-phosphate synthetase-like amidotransferase/phosphosugar isomerase protein